MHFIFLLRGISVLIIYADTSNKNITQPSPTLASFSLKPTVGYPLMKRTFDFVVPQRVSVIRTVGNLGDAAPQDTENFFSSFI